MDYILHFFAFAAAAVGVLGPKRKDRSSGLRSITVLGWTALAVAFFSLGAASIKVYSTRAALEERESYVLSEILGPLVTLQIYIPTLLLAQEKDMPDAELQQAWSLAMDSIEEIGDLLDTALDRHAGELSSDTLEHATGLAACLTATSLGDSRGAEWQRDLQLRCIFLRYKALTELVCSRLDDDACTSLLDLQLFDGYDPESFVPFSDRVGVDR